MVPEAIVCGSMVVVVVGSMIVRLAGWRLSESSCVDSRRISVKNHDLPGDLLQDGDSR